MASGLAIWSLDGSNAVACDEAGCYALDCWTDYLLVSEQELEVPVRLGKALPRLASGEHQALVNFGDYVGEISLAGTRLSVSTAKLDAEGFDRLLRDITARCASLPFDYQSPTLIPYERAALDEQDLLYHAFVYLRWAMWHASPTLLEVLAIIENDPHRMLVRERWTAPPGPCAMSRRRCWRICWPTRASGRSSRRLACTALVAGEAIAALAGRAALPASMPEHVTKTTYDTPENRFVRYFVEFLSELLEQGRHEALPIRWRRRADRNATRHTGGGPQAGAH